MPLLAHSQRALRRYAVMGLLGTVVVGLCWLTIPVVAAPRPFEAHSRLGRLLLWERSTSVHVAAFPSFHVLCAMIAADTLGMRSRLLGAIGWTWATLITVSCGTAGQWCTCLRGLSYSSRCAITASSGCRLAAAGPRKAPA